MPNDKDLKINVNQADGIVTVRLSGEIDLHNSPELRKAFENVLTDQHQAILVEMDEVIYMDSSGLATLIELFQKLQNRDGSLAFSGLGPRIKSLFEMTRLETIFKIFDDRDDGLQYLKSPK